MLTRGAPPNIENPTFMETHNRFTGSREISVRSGPWKLIREVKQTNATLELGYGELYNLENDPGEMDSQFDNKPDIVRDLDHKLASWYGTRRRSQGHQEPAVLSDQATDMLRSLGYVD
jgi:arylsulfatase A-like enzyme